MLRESFARSTASQEVCEGGRYEGPRSRTVCVVTKDITPFLDDLAEVYREAFSGSPWFEEWSVESARGVLEDYARKRADFVVSTDPESGKPLGLGVAFPVWMGARSESFRLREMLSDEQVVGGMFIAELCVAAAARKRGICSDLLDGIARIGRMNDWDVLISQTRTNNEGMIRIFESFGFGRLLEYETITGGVASQRVVFERSVDD